VVTGLVIGSGFATTSVLSNIDGCFAIHTQSSHAAIL
jgi:hypothetical protein